MPRRKRAVLGFSMGFGAFLSRARLLRALRGFLDSLLDRKGLHKGLRSCVHLAQHFSVVGVELVRGRCVRLSHSLNFSRKKFREVAEFCYRRSIRLLPQASNESGLAHRTSRFRDLPRFPPLLIIYHAIVACPEPHFSSSCSE